MIDSYCIVIISKTLKYIFDSIKIRKIFKTSKSQPLDVAINLILIKIY